jgi:hypothetical protein
MFIKQTFQFSAPASLGEVLTAKALRRKENLLVFTLLFIDTKLFDRKYVNPFASLRLAG